MITNYATARSALRSGRERRCLEGRSTQIATRRVNKSQRKSLPIQAISGNSPVRKAVEQPKLGLDVESDASLLLKSLDAPVVSNEQKRR